MVRPEDTAPVPPTDELPDGVILLEDPLEPEQEFWQRYSPHFELPIGWVAGVLVVAVLFAAVVAIVALGNREPDKAGVPIMLDPNGGMDDSGDGMEGGGGQENPKVIADFATPPTKEDIAAVLPDNVTLPDVKADLTKKILAEDPDSQIALSDVAAAKYGGLADDIQKKLLGIGGKQGSGGGPGSGDGPNKNGDGGKGVNGSRARSLRWVLSFRTYSGRDYLDQLASIGAEVAIPIPPDNKEFILFKNLKNPGKGERMTEGQLVRLSGQMQFADIKRESVQAVSDALGLDFTPNSFWAFFPRGAEDELAKLEKGYNNRQPEDIAETKFRVEIVGGRYRFIVASQTLKR